MRLCSALFLMCLSAASLSAKITLPADTIRPDGMYNSYVIYGGFASDSLLDNGHYVLPRNIVEVPIPDAQLEIVYAHNGSISYAATKKPIFDLLPNAERFIIDNDTLTRKEFASIPVALLNSVTAINEGREAVVDMRPSVFDLSSSFRGEQDSEYVWFKKHLSVIPQLDNRLLDVDSFPSDTYISVDYFLRSRNYAKRVTPKAARLSMYGNKLHLELFSDASRLMKPYPQSATIKNFYPSMTIAEILSDLPKSTQTVIWNGKNLIALPIDLNYTGSN